MQISHCIQERLYWKELFVWLTGHVCTRWHRWGTQLSLSSCWPHLFTTYFLSNSFQPESLNEATLVFLKHTIKRRNKFQYKYMLQLFLLGGICFRFFESKLNKKEWEGYPHAWHIVCCVYEYNYGCILRPLALSWRINCTGCLAYTNKHVSRVILYQLYLH